MTNGVLVVGVFNDDMQINAAIRPIVSGSTQEPISIPIANLSNATDIMVMIWDRVTMRPLLDEPRTAEKNTDGVWVWECVLE